MAWTFNRNLSISYEDAFNAPPPKVKHQWTYIEQLMFLRSTFIATCINYLLIAPFYAPETFEFNEEKNVDESATGERGERKLEVKSVYTKNSDLHISLRICASEYRLAAVKCRKFSKRTLYSSCAFELCTNHCLSLYACGSILKTSLTWMWAIAGANQKHFVSMFLSIHYALSPFSPSHESMHTFSFRLSVASRCLMFVIECRDAPSNNSGACTFQLKNIER